MTRPTFTVRLSGYWKILLHAFVGGRERCHHYCPQPPTHGYANKLFVVEFRIFQAAKGPVRALRDTHGARQHDPFFRTIQNDIQALLNSACVEIALYSLWVLVKKCILLLVGGVDAPRRNVLIIG